MNNYLWTDCGGLWTKLKNAFSTGLNKLKLVVGWTQIHIQLTRLRPCPGRLDIDAHTRRGRPPRATHHARGSRRRLDFTRRSSELDPSDIILYVYVYSTRVQSAIRSTSPTTGMTDQGGTIIWYRYVPSCRRAGGRPPSGRRVCSGTTLLYV